MLLRVLLTTVLAIAPAVALATPLTLAGDYQFESTARENGTPVCAETWSFEAQSQTVHSGEEVVHGRFRVEETDGLQVLVTETLDTNGAPDCTGHRSSGPTAGDRRVLLVPMNSGSIMVCPPPPAKPAGPFVIGNCFGSLLARAAP